MSDAKTTTEEPWRATVPGYWMNETSGVLRPVIEAYLHGRDLTQKEIAVMRGYLRQWINAPGFIGPIVEELRASVDALTSRYRITVWLVRAEEAGVDPL